MELAAALEVESKKREREKLLQTLREVLCACVRCAVCGVCDWARSDALETLSVSWRSRGSD